MVTLEQIKALVIASETEWLMEIHDDDEVQHYIDGMTSEVNECDDIQDIAMFYAHSQDKNLEEGLLTVLSIVRRNCVIKEKED
jgi:hypothetical protein